MSWLVLIRHGATDWNRARRIQGHTDTSLSDEGRRQLAALRLPRALRRFKCVSSPLSRALETARILGLEPEASVPELIEMSWGAWEGRKVADLRRRYGSRFTVLESRGLDFRPPGGESPRMVQQRLQAWFARLAEAGEPVVGFTHKGVIRATLSLATGWDMRTAPPFRLDWSCAHVFRLTSDGHPELREANMPLQADASLPI